MPLALEECTPGTLLERFEEAWHNGAAPRLEAYLPAGGPARLRVLEELVPIDLEYRWRYVIAPGGSAGLGERPTLEDYLARHPELAGADGPASALIAWEYRVRQRWGDRPSHALYAARFPRQAAAVQQALWRVDAELAAEFTGPMHAPAPVLPAKVSPGPTASTADMVQVLQQLPLLAASQRAELPGLAARCPEPRALARELLQRGWLTAYQANQLLQGQAADLVLGPYLILERLGKGGVGQVFRARHLKLQRIVALKRIRKELLFEPEVVARFYREMQIISQLSHPNVVHAYDAGPCGNTCFLAMEYVEGTDLNRLVKDRGPLPVAAACEYVRQAATGLQHIHERRLVHRDVKPSNLLLSPKSKVQSPKSESHSPDFGPGTLDFGLIKIADLGLARLQRTVDGGVTAVCTESGTLTPRNAVMIGTPDYLAPEQALDFHGADVRADIYALGCTLYYLLAGRPPFGEGTLAEKLLKHQTVQPTPIQELRPDVPPGVAAVLARMLAKRPSDRYQTPGEVGHALETWAATGQGATPQPATESWQMRQAADRRRWRRRVMAEALVLVAGLALVIYLIVRPTEAPKVRPSSAGSEPGFVGIPRTLPAVLAIQCGAGPGDQDAVQARPGFSYRLLRGTRWASWPATAGKRYCWYDGREVRFEVTVPPGTSGVLRLLLVDGLGWKRQEKVIVQDRPRGTHELTPTGTAVEVVLTAAETSKGKIEVVLQDTLNGPRSYAMVSQVEFLPLASRR